MRSIQRISVLFAIAVAVVASWSAAGAHYADGGSNPVCETEIGYSLTGSWLGHEDDGKVGAERWEKELEFDQTPLVDIQWIGITLPLRIDIDVDPTPGGSPSVVGYTEPGACGDIEINTALTNNLWLSTDVDDQAIRGVVAHEMGHLLGLEHTGWTDDPPFPTVVNDQSESGFASDVSNHIPHMSVCVPSFGGKLDLLALLDGQGDDAGQLVHNVAGGLFPTISANPGFEDSTFDRFWKVSGAASLTKGTGADAKQGAHSAKFTPAANSNKLQQEMNFAAASGDSIGVIGATAQAKRVTPGSASGGRYNLAIWRRFIDYKTEAQAGTCSDEGSFQTGNTVDQNERDGANPAWVKVATGQSTTKPLHNTWYTVSAAYTVPSTEYVVDFKIAFRSSVHISGTHSTIAVDNLHLEDA